MQFDSIFSISFLRVFRSAMGLNAFGAEYKGLPGFGIITKTDSLKCLGQRPTMRHVLANLTVVYHPPHLTTTSSGSSGNPAEIHQTSTGFLLIPYKIIKRLHFYPLDPVDVWWIGGGLVVD